jgi:hypothetical protein
MPTPPQQRLGRMGWPDLCAANGYRHILEIGLEQPTGLSCGNLGLGPTAI